MHNAWIGTAKYLNNISYDWWGPDMPLKSESYLVDDIIELR